MIKITVITVTKNSGASLQRCITSVAEQTHAWTEYIIVDGASTDHTLATIERHSHTVSRYISESDTGIYNAMNKGLRLATGDYIHFLGADDYFLDSGVLSGVAEVLEAPPDCGLAYGGISVRFPDGSERLHMPPPPEEALDVLVCGCLPHQASFASRRTFELAGGFNERYRIAGDYDWFLRVVTHPQVLVNRFERIVASYNFNGVSNDLVRSQEEAYAIQNSFPLYQTPEWMERRLRIFQRELMNSRIECNRLRARTRMAQLIDHALSIPRKELPARAWRYLARRLRDSTPPIA